MSLTPLRLPLQDFHLLDIMWRVGTHPELYEYGTVLEKVQLRVIHPTHPFLLISYHADNQCRIGEYPIISGRINDIAWDGDSQRIIAVGDGKGRFGHCITADSGNSVGEISGQSAQINSASIRQQRPLRAATASDDTSMAFYHGAPFKFNTSLRGQHSRFVYGVAFSPDGSSLVSVGADQKVWLYDGKTGEVKGELGSGEHKGSVFAVSWAKDSKKFVTSSADQTVKIWDAEAGKVVKTWKFGDIVSPIDHQVGVVWPSGRSDGLVISLNLNGDLNYLDEKSDKPIKIVQSHQKNITAAGLSSSTPPTLFTGSSDGRVLSWDIPSGKGTQVSGSPHTNYVSGFTATEEGQGRIYSIGWDDTLRSIDSSANTFTGTSAKLEGQPVSISTSLGSKVVFIATNTGIQVFVDGEQTTSFPTKDFTPTAIAESDNRIAVGGSDHKIYIYTLKGSDFTLLTTLTEPRSAVSTLSFSPTGSHLAVGCSDGKIFVYGTSGTDLKLETNRWSAHTAKVTSISWNKAGSHAVSGALDTNIFVWSLKEPGKRVRAANTHKEGVNGVEWVDEKRIISVGADAAVKLWTVGGLV
jgi:WD repeat-containing protein 1 (actin-interacting protein 1)